MFPPACRSGLAVAGSLSWLLTGAPLWAGHGTLACSGLWVVSLSGLGEGYSHSGLWIQLAALGWPYPREVKTVIKHNMFL